MNWPVRLTVDAEKEVKEANNPEIRSFTVNFHSSLVPMKLPPAAKWEVCTPEFARNFSAVGYFFAREINSTKKVPIGLIHSSAGATAAEAWTSVDAMREKMPYDFLPQLAELKEKVDAIGPNYDFFQALEKWTATVDPQSAQEKYPSNLNLDTKDWVDIEVPKPWQEAGLKDFHGLVWFRHEIDIPESWSGKDLTLGLSTINDMDVVWFNGKVLGSKQLPGIRNYLVDAKLVKPGKNLLVAAIVNKTGPGGFVSAPSQYGGSKPATNPGTDAVRLRRNLEGQGGREVR